MDTILTIATAAGTSSGITLAFLWTRYRFQLRAERAMLTRWSRRDAQSFIRTTQGR